MGITAYRLAKEPHFPGIYEILREELAVSADVALRLGKYFGMTSQFWMNLQGDYDLRLAAASARPRQNQAALGRLADPWRQRTAMPWRFSGSSSQLTGIGLAQFWAESY